MIAVKIADCLNIAAIIRISAVNITGDCTVVLYDNGISCRKVI